MYARCDKKIVNKSRERIILSNLFFWTEILEFTFFFSIEINEENTERSGKENMKGADSSKFWPKPLIDIRCARWLSATCVPRLDKLTHRQMKSSYQTSEKFGKVSGCRSRALFFFFYPYINPCGKCDNLLSTLVSLEEADCSEAKERRAKNLASRSNTIPWVIKSLFWQQGVKRTRS